MKSVGGIEQAAINQSFSDPSKSLRILLDARKLGDGGIGVYIENLIFGLQSLEAADLTLIVKPNAEFKFPFLKDFKTIEEGAPLYSFSEMFALNKRIDFSRFDLFHVPHYTLPFGIKIPTVITVHDLIHVNFPQKKYYPLISTPLIKSSLKRAGRVITVSQASFNEIAKFSKSNSAVLSKTSVIPNAIDPLFIDRASQQNENTSNRQKFCGKYFLAVASNLKPHKGIADLLEAFKLLRADRNAPRSLNDAKLVLVGQGTENLAENEAVLEAAAGIKGVHMLGSVSKSELISLYQGAMALIVASKAEGFCLPVIEAQAVGTPVISRPVAAVQELLTEADYVCDDFSVQSLVQTIKKFFIERSESDAARKIAVQHLRKFDRKDLARNIMQVYYEVAAGRHAGDLK